MGKQTLQGEIVNKYIAEFPETSNLGLARLIYAENPSVWKDVEAVRCSIRYYTGNQGSGHRKRIPEKNIRQPAENAKKLGISNPFGLPESEEVEWTPFELLPQHNNTLILSDIHIPYHSVEALTLAIEYGLKNNINSIVLNGDILDVHEMSKYEKDPRKKSFAEELDICRDFLQVLKKVFPDAGMYFKMGNHDERYEKYLRMKAPELYGIEEFRLDVLLRLGELQCKFIADKRIIKAGHLNILHGHEFGNSTFSPVNPARGYYTKAKASVICGHNHQTSEHPENNLENKVVTTWSTGCLSELHPQYMPINKWNLGFARVQWDKDNHEVNNLRIVNGKIR